MRLDAGSRRGGASSHLVAGDAGGERNGGGGGRERGGRLRRPGGVPAAVRRRAGRGGSGGARRRLGFDRGGPWRRERAAVAAATSASRERGGEVGDCARNFAEKSVCFSLFAKMSFAALKFGLRVRFSASGGAFSQNRHGRLQLTVGSPFDGSDRRYCSYCTNYSAYCSKNSARGALRPPFRPSFIYT